jgi:hypothetical protein
LFACNINEFSQDLRRDFMTRYIYAKIDNGNRLANTYLQGNCEMNSPAIPIYFDTAQNNEADFLAYGGAREQGRLFFECGHNPSDKVIVVIYDGQVVFLEPTGEVVFEKSTVRPNGTGYVKLLPVKLTSTMTVTDIPLVLAGIGANRYYSSGTFREIGGNGNKLAIKSVLNQPISPPSPPNVLAAIECLGSVELETLVAKLFEEAGCFVPAYLGGNMQGADLFVYNKTTEIINIATIVLKPGDKKSIQVKLGTNLTRPPTGVDILIAGNVATTPQTFGNQWFHNALKQSQKTREWLYMSLAWLPKSYIAALHTVL